MHNATFKRLTKDMEKYKNFTESLGIVQASSFASMTKTSTIQKIIENNKRLFQAFDRNSIFENQSRLFDDRFQNNMSAIRSLKNNKSYLLSNSEKIRQSLDSILKPIGIVQASSFASMTKTSTIQKIIENNKRLFQAFDRNSIFENKSRQVNLQVSLNEFAQNLDNDIATKVIESMQNQPIAVLNTDYVLPESEFNEAIEVFQNSDQHSFLDTFHKLPIFQMIIIYFLITLPHDVLTNIIANILTPYTEQSIENDSKKYQKKYQFKKWICHILDLLPPKMVLMLDHLRT